MERDENEVRSWHDPNRDRPLSDAVLSALSKAKGEELTKAECDLYEDIDPAAIDALFRESGSGRTAVMFNAPDAGIRLIGGDKIEIRVATLE